MISGRATRFTTNRADGHVVLEVEGLAEGTEVHLQLLLGPAEADDIGRRIRDLAVAARYDRAITAILLSRGHTASTAAAMLADIRSAVGLA